MKIIEDYIDEKFQPLLNKSNVIKSFLSNNKKLIDSLYSEILKNIEIGNLKFLIELNETVDMNIVNVIINKMNNNGWKCEYGHGDYKTSPYITFTFIDLSNPNAQMVHDYYNK